MARKLQEKLFAATLGREAIRRGIEPLGADPDQRLRLVTMAPRRHAAEPRIGGKAEASKG